MVILYVLRDMSNQKWSGKKKLYVVNCTLAGLTTLRAKENRKIRKTIWIETGNKNGDLEHKNEKKWIENRNWYFDVFMTIYNAQRHKKLKCVNVERERYKIISY